MTSNNNSHSHRDKINNESHSSNILPGRGDKETCYIPAITIIIMVILILVTIIVIVIVLKFIMKVIVVIYCRVGATRKLATSLLLQS